MKNFPFLIILLLLMFGCTSKKDNYRIEKFIFLSYRYNDPAPLEDYIIDNGVSKPILHVIGYFEIADNNKARVSKASLGKSRVILPEDYGYITIRDEMIALIDSTLYNKAYDYAYYNKDPNLFNGDVEGHTLVYKFKGQNEKVINYYNYSTTIIPQPLKKLHEEIRKNLKTSAFESTNAFTYNVDLIKIQKDFDHYMGIGPPEGMVIGKIRK